MVRIKSINWVSKDVKEAEVTISDGIFDLLCFSHPCSYKENEKVTDKIINVFEAEDMYLEDDKNYFISRLENQYYGYHIRCQLIDKRKKLLKLGEFTLEIDTDIPTDIETGSFISFNCGRLDLY